MRAAETAYRIVLAQMIPASVQEFGNYVFDNSTAVSIHGYANTTAQTYAENHSISFVTLDCAHTNTKTKYAYSSNACNDGYTGDVYCVDCGLLLQQGKTIAATGHRYIKVSETPATCTEAGVIKYMCSGCKQSYEVLIPATAHDYQSEVVAATCSQSGYTQYTCTVCGYSYRTDYTQPGAHSFVKTTVAATCTAAGYDCYTCSVCGSAYTTGFTAPLGHDLQVIQTDDQSESNGHIFEYLRCARCMDTATDTIRTTHVTDASGHYVWKAGCYQDQVVQAGDCTHKEIVRRVCTVEDPTGTGTCAAEAGTMWSSGRLLWIPPALLTACAPAAALSVGKKYSRRLRRRRNMAIFSNTAERNRAFAFMPAHGAE